MRTVLSILSVLSVLTLLGCDDDSDHAVRYVYYEDSPPPVPQGVYSVTGDREVFLYWLPVDDVNGDFSQYIVYRSDFDPDTGYVEIARTTNEYHIDRSVTNGHTYFYAVSSMDTDGNVSDLSYEYVFDTPRPQGSNRTLFDFNTLPLYAGWDFSAEQIVPYNHINCDIYLEYYVDHGVFYLNVGDINTDIQDMGYTADFDEINFSPEDGWSELGWIEVIIGHTYVIWTADNHYAKIRVTAINGTSIIFDWAYQVDAGNPELKPLVGKPQVPRPEGYLRHPGGDVVGLDTWRGLPTVNEIGLETFSGRAGE